MGKSSILFDRFHASGAFPMVRTVGPAVCYLRDKWVFADGKWF